MMYKAVSITSEIATVFFFSDPILILLGLSDEEMAIMHKLKKYELSEGSNYIGIQDSHDKLVAIVKYEWFTTHTINFHMYIQSKYHHTKEIKSITNFIKQYFKDTLKINKAIIMVPSSCDHIHSFAPKYGFKKEGHITNAYQWRQELVDIIIYGLDLQVLGD